MSAWLSVIGIGEDGLDGLGAGARVALDRAEILYGGERHLGFVADDGRERVVWPSPLQQAFDGLLARKPRSVAVLATGDPMWFGIGRRLAAIVPPEEMRVFPAPSALSLTCARMGWSVPDVEAATLHGREPATLEPYIQPGARLVVLTADETTPTEIARRLTARGFGPSRLTVLERMGGPHERRREARADAFGLNDIAPLNTVAVECLAGPDAVVRARGPGLADEAFEHDGQITKRETRSVTLARLMPTPGALLWDIGAGSGSVSIEWMRAEPHTKAIAIEPRADRMARLVANAERLGVPRLETVQGSAPEALAGLVQPDAVFIGGGLAGDDGEAIIGHALEALKPGGRVVANAVTLASESVLMHAHDRHGGDLVRLSVARAEPVGPHVGWRPLMPVTQWACVKPWETA